MSDTVLSSIDIAETNTGLTQAELVALAKKWAPCLGNGGGSGQPEQRWYVRLEHNDLYEVWLLGWSGTSGTEFHDHGGSAGAVSVIAGEVRETRLRHGGSVIRRTFGAGSTFSFGSNAIHDVQNSRGQASLTVHVYSPPLTNQTYYEPDAISVVPVRHVLVEGPEEGAVDLTGQL
jgi:hypothetical protein